MGQTNCAYFITPKYNKYPLDFHINSYILLMYFWVNPDMLVSVQKL